MKLIKEKRGISNYFVAFLMIISSVLYFYMYADVRLTMLCTAAFILSFCLMAYVIKNFIIKYPLTKFNLNNDYSKDLVLRALGRNKTEKIYQSKLIRRCDFNKVADYRINELTRN